jgi:hypothetical protein
MDRHRRERRRHGQGRSGSAASLGGAHCGRRRRRGAACAAAIGALAGLVLCTQGRRRVHQHNHFCARIVIVRIAVPAGGTAAAAAAALAPLLVDGVHGSRWWRRCSGTARPARLHSSPQRVRHDPAKAGSVPERCAIAGSNAGLGRTARADARGQQGRQDGQQGGRARGVLTAVVSGGATRRVDGRLRQVQVQRGRGGPPVPR